MPTASRPFQIFVKPAGAICNLDCRYCYYLEKRDLHPAGQSPRMADNLLERYIVQHIDASPDPVIAFSWHGGEPTVLGVDYFRRIVELQRRHQRPGRPVVNGIQTNGLLIDEQWCRFLSAERFRVGLSIDGPPELHDCYRVTRGQQPTHAQAMHAFELLQRHRIPTDVLCVVHNENVRRPLAVYRFLKRIGASSISFLPLVRRDRDAERRVTPETVPADAYGAFLCAIFDEWVERDTARIAVQLFDEATRPARGMDHSLCIFRQTCGDVPVVECNGDFYCCDHFVDAEHRIGNVLETPLVELLESPEQRVFGQAKCDALPQYCRSCSVLPMCNGGCPKDRFIVTPDGEAGLNYLCAGFKRFFTHVLPHANKVAAERRAAREQLMQPGQATLVRGGPAVGRNDPCPCGSGRKYKRCCLGKAGES